MRRYPKIQTLYKRDKEKNYTIIEGDYSKEEFTMIDRWGVTEKIDGMNIRVHYDGFKVLFGGRTDKALIPVYLLDELKKLFFLEKFRKVFGGVATVTLYGEGYGERIQKGGGKYLKGHSFILFDALINGFWLERDKVEELAEQLNISVVPFLGVMSKEEIVVLTKSKPFSSVSYDCRLVEGFVARSVPLLLFRDGSPLMFKLKVEDFVALERF